MTITKNRLKQKNNNDQKQNDVIKFLNPVAEKFSRCRRPFYWARKKISVCRRDFRDLNEHYRH